MGVESITTNNSIHIIGGNPHSAVIKTYDDHRMALAFSIAGSVINGMGIENPHVVIKSFPSYWDVVKKLGIRISH